MAGIMYLGNQMVTPAIVSGGVDSVNGQTGEVVLTASDVNALPDTTKYAKTLGLSMNQTTFVLSWQLYDQNGDPIGQVQTVDLPLESVVVNATYDSTNKKIVLTLENGTTVDVPVGDLVEGLQSEITITNMLSSDLVDDTNKTHKFVTTEEKTTWNNKQNAINDLATIRSGAAAGATAVQPATLNNYVPTSRTVNGQPLSSDVTIDTLPSQTGQSGKYLMTDGTTPSWGTINALQNQANNASSLDIFPLSGSPTITGNNNVLLHSKASSATNINMVGINVAFGTIGYGAVGIGANNASGFNSVAIGSGAQTQVSYQLAIGTYAHASGSSDIAVGYHAQIKSGLSNCIQLGYGNSDQDSSFSFYVGFNTYGNYKLLDGTTGKIPDGRLPIATSASSSSTNAEVVGAKLFYDTCGDIVTLINAL